MMWGGDAERENVFIIVILNDVGIPDILHFPPPDGNIIDGGTDSGIAAGYPKRF